jgi:molecular chaperone GrpE
MSKSADPHDPPAPEPLPPEPPEGAEAAPIGAEELAQLQAQAARAGELEDRLKRAQADFVNEGRRLQRQAEQDRRFALEGLIKDLAHVVENLDTALKATGEGSDVAALKQGVELVLHETEAVLKRHHAEVLRPLGQPFDPLRHEAVAMVDHPGLPPGSVAHVLSPGMLLHGRVVRPARVTVVKAPAAASATPDDASASQEG